MTDQRDTFFEIMRTDADGLYYVLRIDRQTLPMSTVVSGPHKDRRDAARVAEQMRKTGIA